MWVNRRTFRIRKGKMAEAVAFLKRISPPAWKGRVYFGGPAALAPLDLVSIEWQFETLEDYAAAMAGMADPGGGSPANEELDQLTVPGGSSEIWRVEELG